MNIHINQPVSWATNTGGQRHPCVPQGLDPGELPKSLMVSSGYSTLINHGILDYPILGKHPIDLIHEIHDKNNYPMKQ
jgi:hypothetical protein